MHAYDPKKIEKKWQKEWAKKKLYQAKKASDAPKSYVLDMFPYPSGEGLHVGHPKGYIATDIYSRFKRMNGANVLHPMGWDAFGLPAENYAIKNKVHPRKSVEKNIKNYKDQLSIIGLDYDWSREIDTTDPEYYRWTQWIFLKMYEKGLAYQSHEPINWCPSCQTGLANEDVEDGKCERCGSVVEKRPMRQWVLRITDYAERLLADLNVLNWPESIKESQRNWIGKSEGAEIDFALKCNNIKEDSPVTVFTTRPETIFGVTYLVLAPEHTLVQKLHKKISNWEEVQKYILDTKSKDEISRTAEGKEKSGIELKGLKAINPANNEEISVWIADYVLASYGSGAVMAVPAHDERDFKFAQKYKLPINQVIAPFFIDKDNPPKDNAKWAPRKVVQALIKHPSENKIIQLKWKKVPWKTLVIGGVEDGETYEQAVVREVTEETGYKNFKKIEKLGWVMESQFYAEHKDVNRQAFSQVYYIELADLEKNDLSQIESSIHEVTWVPITDISKTFGPIAELPEIVAHLERGPHAFTGSGKLINSGKFFGQNSHAVKNEITTAVGGRIITKYKLRDWVFSRQRYWGEPIPLIHCLKCGVVPVPEKNLPVKLPEVKHYEPTGTGESPLRDIEKWVNVKCPKCGGKGKRETNTMPQWAGSSWYYLRYMDPKNRKALVDSKAEKYWAPVDMYVGGAEHATRHLIYARFWHKFLYDIGITSTIEPFSRYYYVGLILAPDGRKMSKRYGNVINPDEIVKTYGADTLRVYEMFMGPFTQQISWDTKSIIGSRRFIEKIWRIAERLEKVGKLERRDGPRGMGFRGAMAIREAPPSLSATISPLLETLLHKTIKKVTEDIEKFNFNTAISSMMVLVNEMEKLETVPKEIFEIILKLLAPFAPHVSEELWASFGNKKSVHISSWPAYDEAKLSEEKVTIAVQVNGKVRGEIEIKKSDTDEGVKEKVASLEIVKKWLEGKEIRKIIYVKNRLINIVG